VFKSIYFGDFVKSQPTIWYDCPIKSSQDDPTRNAHPTVIPMVNERRRMEIEVWTRRIATDIVTRSGFCQHEYPEQR
jgi:hypothetical protein